MVTWVSQVNTTTAPCFRPMPRSGTQYQIVECGLPQGGDGGHNWKILRAGSILPICIRNWFNRKIRISLG